MGWDGPNRRGLQPVPSRAGPGRACYGLPRCNRRPPFRTAAGPPWGRRHRRHSDGRWIQVALPNRNGDRRSGPGVLCSGNDCGTRLRAARPVSSLADSRQDRVRAVGFLDDPHEALAPAPVPGSVVPLRSLYGAMAEQCALGPPVLNCTYGRGESRLLTAWPATRRIRVKYVTDRAAGSNEVRMGCASWKLNFGWYDWT